MRRSIIFLLALTSLIMAQEGVPSSAKMMGILLQEERRTTLENVNRQAQTTAAEIHAFASQKDQYGHLKHPQFERVRKKMAALIEQGKAKTLEQAYTLAVSPKIIRPAPYVAPEPYIVPEVIPGLVGDDYYDYGYYDDDYIYPFVLFEPFEHEHGHRHEHERFRRNVPPVSTRSGGVSANTSVAHASSATNSGSHVRRGGGEHVGTGGGHAGRSRHK